MVKELNPNGDDDKRIVTVLADLSDMNSVSAAGDEIKSRFKSIDYLVNNAGMTNNSYQKQETVQGFDTVFAVNSPPQIRRLEHTPKQPAEGDIVTITALITDSNTI